VVQELTNYKDSKVQVIFDALPISKPLTKVFHALKCQKGAYRIKVSEMDNKTSEMDNSKNHNCPDICKIKNPI
jgi:hypothetical protein